MPQPIELTLALFVILPIITLVIILCTNVRYAFCPEDMIANVVVYASIVIGFIILYGATKFDITTSDDDIYIENLTYLKDIALKYDPSAICFLLKSLNIFYDNQYAEENSIAKTAKCANVYALYQFSDQILPKIKDEVIADRVKELVSDSQERFYTRINGTHIISNKIWYLVLTVLIILTLTFILDHRMGKFDAVLTLILVWVPVIGIKYLYNQGEYRIRCQISQAIKSFSIPGLNCCQSSKV